MTDAFERLSTGFSAVVVEVGGPKLDEFAFVQHSCAELRDTEVPQGTSNALRARHICTITSVQYIYMGSIKVNVLLCTGNDRES